MPQFPSSRVLKNFTGVCDIETSLRAACGDHLDVKSREGVWKGRRQLVLPTWILQGGWAAWTIETQTSREERMSERNVASLYFNSRIDLKGNWYFAGRFTLKRCSVCAALLEIKVKHSIWIINQKITFYD